MTTACPRPIKYTASPSKRGISRDSISTPNTTSTTGFRQYPNLALFNAERDFEDASFRADAWMVNLSYLAFPWFFFGEAFSMDRGYSTSPFTVDTSGDITYDNPTMFFLRVRRRQRRPGSLPRLVATQSTGIRPAGLSRLGRKQRFRLRLQPERQRDDQQPAARLRRAFPALRSGPSRVPLRHRSEQQCLDRPFRKRRGARLPLQKGPPRLQCPTAAQSWHPACGSAWAGRAKS